MRVFLLISGAICLFISGVVLSDKGAMLLDAVESHWLTGLGLSALFVAVFWGQPK